MSPRLFAGIDIGAQSVKAVLFDGRRMLGSVVRVSDEQADAAARAVYSELLLELGLTTASVASVFTTGWGAREVGFADRRSSEQVCASLAARWLIPTARTVLDIGAEGCRAMTLDV